MKQHAKRLMKHPLIYGSSVLVLGTLAANFFNFLFNIFMIRSLSNADYGIYASIISIIAFPALIANAMIPIVVQFAGTYFAKGQLDMVKGFYTKIMKFFVIISMVIFILFLFFIPQISAFLHIENDLILVITDLIILLSIVGLVNSAFIQAKLAFGFQVFVTLVASVTKLLFGILIILLGYSVTGAVFATLISALAAYLVSFAPIRFVFEKKTSSPKIHTKELLSYGIPSTLTLVGLTALISTDILLVKHFFDPVHAGIYAGLSLVGRIIFYISSPITSVMFPIIVQKHSNNEKFTNTLILALLMVTIPSLLLTLGYFLFPDSILLFFTKKPENLVVSPLLGLFGIFITFYCMLYMMANFYLSIKKTNIYIPVLIGAAAQTVLIFIYHQSFIQIISISIGITFLLICALFLYFPYAKRK
jgi:O-antigen/teichoic acid export membrane protein